MEKEALIKIFKDKRKRIDGRTGKIKQGFEYANIEDFEKWFAQSNFDKGCYYCGTTNQQCEQMFNMQRNGNRHDATRGGKRGKRLELDRKNPELPYDQLDNIVWCCYWCNNAKSNFFTETEFAPIAKAIGEALSKLK